MTTYFNISSSVVLTEELFGRAAFSYESIDRVTEQYKIKWPKGLRDAVPWFNMKSVWGISSSFFQSSVDLLPSKLFESSATVHQLLTGNLELAWIEYLTTGQKLQELKRRHFTAIDRSVRIALANAALNRSLLKSDLDKATWRWVAQDVDLEDI